MARRKKRNRKNGSGVEKKIGLIGKIKARVGSFWRKSPRRDDDVWAAGSVKRKSKSKGKSTDDEPNKIVSDANVGDDDVKVGPWTEPPRKIRWRAFPQPGPIDEPLRIDMSGDASTEVLAHARQSLDAEVCGVLVGDVCEDEQGKWVSVKAAIRGTSTKKGGAHVTYTQETWDKIHQQKDRDYKKLAIVGWYHSHPGFGVTFSDMDKFIQQNFFSGETQFALVIDPLGGDEAVCVNRGADIEYVARIWLAGRQRVCRVPQSQTSKRQEPSAKSGSSRSERSGESIASDLDRRLRSLERRMTEFIETAEQDRNVRQRWILVTGGIVSIAAILLICLTIYDRTTNKPTAPPELKQAIPVGLQSGPYTIPIENAMLTWKVPDGLMEFLLEMEERRLAEEEAKRKEEAEANEDKEKAAEEENEQAE